MTELNTQLKVPLEWMEQKWLVDWLNVHPTLKDLFFKTNNEGKRTGQQAHYLKQMGLRVGVSDLFICYPSNGFHGLFLEVKRNKKYTPSDRLTTTWLAQEKFINTVKNVGFQAHICYGWVDGKKIIEAYLL